MSKILFYDTETTGLPFYNEPSEDPKQPHIVELAALLVDEETQEVIQGFEAIIKPDGWIIPDDVAAIHGITTDRALVEGVSEFDVLQRFLFLWGQADRRIAHNESFDARIIRIALKRYLMEETAEAFKGASSECTARLSVKIVNLPPTEKMLASGRKTPKTPTLGESYKHFFGEEAEGMHRAMVDTMACMKIYFAIQDKARTAA